MKVYVDVKEFWPVLKLYKTKDECFTSETLEISEELFNEYKAAMKAFNQVQFKLEEIRNGNS